MEIIVDMWCTGSASESRSEGCVYGSRRIQLPISRGFLEFFLKSFFFLMNYLYYDLFSYLFPEFPPIFSI